MCHSPYCLLYNSCDVTLENLVLDQEIILLLTFLFILITWTLDIVLIEEKFCLGHSMGVKRTGNGNNILWSSFSFFRTNLLINHHKPFVVSFANLTKKNILRVSTILLKVKANNICILQFTRGVLSNLCTRIIFMYFMYVECVILNYSGERNTLTKHKPTTNCCCF